MFTTISAWAGGIGLIVTNGLGFSPSALNHSPFLSFTVPGLILLVIVSGTQGLAAALLIFKHGYALLTAAVAGFGLIIWIYSEIYITQVTSWLQTLYLAVGILELILILLVLKVIPSSD